MGTTSDGLLALGVIFAASLVALVFAIARLSRRGRAVPAPWQFPDPFRRPRR